MIVRGVTFRDYDVAGPTLVEVCFEDGVITTNLPDEIKSPHVARAYAEALMAAADAMEFGK